MVGGGRGSLRSKGSGGRSGIGRKEREEGGEGGMGVGVGETEREWSGKRGEWEWERKGMEEGERCLSVYQPTLIFLPTCTFLFPQHFSLFTNTRNL